MDVQLSILNTSDVPIYQQLYEQLSSQIVKGELAGGVCLPPIRTIASALGISIITIKRAWEELERSGFITTMVGRGCFVVNMSIEEREKRRNELAAEHFSRNAAYYEQLGLDRASMHRLVDEFYGER